MHPFERVLLPNRLGGRGDDLYCVDLPMPPVHPLDTNENDEENIKNNKDLL